MTGRTRVAIHAGIATVAAASSLSAIYRGLGWLVPVAAAVAIVVGAGELTRRSPIPVALSPLLSAVGVLVLLTRLYAAKDAWLGLIPTKTSMSALGDVARSGFADVRKLAPPVPPHHGLVLLAVVGVAAIALVVDLLAVTLRRVALAGLPLLALFVTGTSVAKHGAAWWTFVVAAAGFLWLLLADSRDRLSRWGRSLGFDRDSRPRFSWSDEEVVPSPLSVMGRRVGVTAIAVGVFLPILVPGLHGGVPHGGGGGFGLGGHGRSSVAITVNPIVTIRAQLTSSTTQPLFNVRTDDPSPGYLRLTSLDKFDGDTFSPSTLQQGASAQVSRGIAVAPIPGRTVHSDVAVNALAVHWLPVPTQVTDVQVAGDWRYDAPTNTVFSARSDTRNLNYSVVSVHPNPSPTALEAAASDDPSVASYLKLPTIPSDVRDLTQRVTANAVSNFDKALAIQRFLTSAPFTYDTSVSTGSGTRALEEFLLRDHRGFCQQYATAMAVMARIAHIPSRLAVGFTHGDVQPDGSWLVTTKDAHAWPELYFNGFGWLAFEPTPRRDGQATPPPYTAVKDKGNNKPSPGQTGIGKGNKAKSATARSKNQRLDDNADAAASAGPVPRPDRLPASHHARRILLLTLLVLIGVMLIAPSIVHAVVSRRRWTAASSPGERASAAWAALRACAIDARLPWVDGLSPRATARLLRIEAPGLAPAELRALDRVVEAVQRAWYAADPSSSRVDGLRDDVEEIRAALLAESTAGERFVLRAWPRSTLRDARVALGRVGELLDVLDLRAARLRARLRPRHA
jgi:transglutaminase-like putative cysteine protease